MSTPVLHLSDVCPGLDLPGPDAGLSGLPQRDQDDLQRAAARALGLDPAEVRIEDDGTVSLYPAPKPKYAEADNPPYDIATDWSRLGNVPGPSLPGMGEPRENCGEYFPAAFCASTNDQGVMCGRPKLIAGSCNRRDCPRCWTRWRSRRIEAALERIGGYDMAQWLDENPARHPSDWRDLSHQRVVHAVISFEDDQGRALGEEAFKTQRRRAAKIAREAGFEGGVVVPHFYRIREELKPALKAAGYGQYDAKGGLWNGVRANALDLASWRDYVYPALHFHVIGPTGKRWSGDEQLLPGDEVGGDEVFFKRVGGERGSLRDVASTLGYLLSHTWAYGRKHTVTWFGALAYTKFSPDHLPGNAQVALEWAIEEALEPERDDACEDDAGEGCPCCGGTDERGIWLADEVIGQARMGALEIRYDRALLRAWRLSKFGWDNEERRAEERGRPPPDRRSLEEVELWLGLQPYPSQQTTLAAGDPSRSPSR